jgi:structure-specific recognition protein 1
VPRGRYDLEFFDKHFKMHGKTYDYKVLYSNVSSVYVLPKQDNYTMAFVMSLEHPLRQGATMYPHIVMQLPREAVVEVNINMPDAERQRRFDDKLEKQESGDLVDVLPKVKGKGGAGKRARGRARGEERGLPCPCGYGGA